MLPVRMCIGFLDSRTIVCLHLYVHIVDANEYLDRPGMDECEELM